MKHLPPVKNYHAKKWDERVHQDRKKRLELHFWASKNRQALEIMRLAIPAIPSHGPALHRALALSWIFDTHPMIEPIAMHPEIPNAFRIGVLNERREEMLLWLDERGLTTIARPVGTRSGVDLLFEDASQAMLFKMTFF